jgi:ubiquinone biosynthesis protein
MRWWRLDLTFRDIRRTRQIIGVLVRYGFGEVVEAFAHELPFRRVFRRGEGAEAERLSTGERLRLALQELGPTFVKLGQLLSTRPDLLPPDIQRELTRLQDEVPPVSLAQVRAVVEKELGAPLERLFREFSPEPAAAASVAQVHRAQLPSGEVAAVKVVRPGIAPIIEADLGILAALVGMAEKRSAAFARYRPLEVLEEFRRYLTRELDLTHEAATMALFAENFRDDEGIVIPRVHPALTGPSVLTMEWIDGIPLSRTDRLRERGVDLARLGRMGAAGILRQIFEFGLFHGDPHPGNVLVTPEGRLALLDFGIVGRLSDELRDQITDLLLGLVRPDAEVACRAILELGGGGEDVDEVALREDVTDLIGRYHGMPLRMLIPQRVLGDAFSVMHRHGITVPPQLALLVKVLAQVDGVGRSLDPDFSVVEEARPFVEGMVERRYSPARLLREGKRALGETRRMLRRLPGDVSEILRRLRGGRFKMEMEHTGLSRLLGEMDRVSNRLAVAVIIAAVIVGSSLILTISRGPQLMGLPVLGMAGFVFAGGLGLWLVVDILRTGRY